LNGDGGTYACFSRDGALLLTANASEIQLWDAKRFAPVGKPMPYPGDFITAGFTLDGKAAHVVHTDGVWLWEPKPGSLLSIPPVIAWRSPASARGTTTR